MSEIREFITFGFDHKIGDYSLANHYMLINREDTPDVIAKTPDGYLEFAFSYPIDNLEDQLDKWKLKEITIEQYLEYKDE